MTWNFEILRENAPLGFKPLETHCFYYGSPPATKFSSMVGIDNYLEIPKTYLGKNQKSRRKCSDCKAGNKRL